MFIAETRVTNQWAELSDVTFESGTTYTIVNNSSDVIYAVEGDSEPEDTITGVPVAPGNYIKYEPGEQNIYFRNRKQSVSNRVEYSKLLVNSVDEV